MSSLDLFESRLGGSDLEQGFSAFAAQSLTHLSARQIKVNRQHHILASLRKTQIVTSTHREATLTRTVDAELHAFLEDMYGL